MNISLSLPGRGILRGVASVALAFSLVCCSGGGTEQQVQQALGADVAPGVILVDILEAGHPEHYRQYEVQPTAGSVRRVKEETFSDYLNRDLPRFFLEPTGSLSRCSSDNRASSPDGKYVAYCAGGDGGLSVHDQTGVGNSHLWKPRGWRGIRGFGWAPNSGSVAILNVSSYVGKTPLELLAAFSGHPVPHDTIFLDILDVRTGTTTEYLVRKNVVSSFTRILKWSE